MRCRPPTEGWDTRTVTYVLGYRRFSTQLLCEQVTGRALRRSNYDSYGHDGTLTPEYAEVIGVPFEFLPTKDADEPPAPPKPRYEVHSVPGRQARWNEREWPCPPGEQWRVSMEGMDRLAELGRLDSAGPNSTLRWKWYEDEVPGRRINNMWHRQRFASDKRYVVQTADSVIERCVLMATDPGDLVFDLTCGGATTAVAAEKWGRRWITCDTSPIAVSIARQRIATSTFPYWTLSSSADGAAAEAKLSGSLPGDPPGDGWSSDPADGFVCERVPQVSAATLAYDRDPDPIMLVDRPVAKRGVIRVASPLTVESEQPWATVVPLEGTADASVTAHGDFCRAVEHALRAHTVTGGRGDPDMHIVDLEPWPGEGGLLEWKAAYTVGGGATEHAAAVMAAAEDVTVPGEMIREAAREAADSAEGSICCWWWRSPMAPMRRRRSVAASTKTSARRSPR